MGRGFDSLLLHLWLVVQRQNGRLLTVMSEVRILPGQQQEGVYMKNVLDRGYVRTVHVLGTDLDVVNAARVSFDKEVSELSDKDENLIRYLVEHKHDAVFRHCVMTFEIYAPLMVARQWYKHAVASSHLDDQFGWNESSRRYITENEQFYIPRPQNWRAAPQDKKQGSGQNLAPDAGAIYTKQLQRIVDSGYMMYRMALSDGIAPEQARLLLPAYSMYVRWRWTASLNALLHFIALRNESHAQYEIQEYAGVILEEVSSAYPLTTKYWLEHRIS